MDFSSAPVIKHRDWRFLLRDLVSSNAAMRPMAGGLLQSCLSPVASAAWWLLKFAPEVVEAAVERGSLQLLLPGVCTETSDGGRWFAFLPWMLGLPGLKTHVYMVGDQLVGSKHGPESSKGMSLMEMERHWRTPAVRAVEHAPPATIFNGVLSKWRAKGGSSVRVDACIVYSPGMSSHYDSWLRDEDLLSYLRNGTAVGMFGYSPMDCMEDREVLAMAGVVIEGTKDVLNPWRLDHDMSAHFGCFARLGWRCKATSVPLAVNMDGEALKEFQSLQMYLQEDFQRFGGDKALERLGARWPVRSANGKGDDAILVLPRGHGILESSRHLGEFDDKGFTPFDPAIVAPAELVARRPTDELALPRLMWAAKTHRDWVAPALEDHEESDGDLLFPDMTPESMRESMKAFLEDALGREVDPDAFIQQMRESGGMHGPTHHAWFDLLSTIEWDPQDWVDEPERYEPAFKLPMKRRSLALPAICEAYAYFPDDPDDALAKRAMARVQRKYPKGAVLFFKSIPYTEVEGHKYQFGGMLWWDGRWTPFAIGTLMRSVDEIVEQVESGFSIGQANERYADDSCGITIGLNLMCQGLNPNEPRKMMGLGQGRWVTLMPSE